MSEIDLAEQPSKWATRTHLHRLLDRRKETQMRTHNLPPAEWVGSPAEITASFAPGCKTHNA